MAAKKKSEVADVQTTWKDVAEVSAAKPFELPAHARKFEQLLYVPLTDEEVREWAKKLASAAHRRGELEIKKKKDADQVKEAIAGVASHMRDLMTELGEARQERSVPCAEVRDDKTHVMRTYRLDTNEEIDIRPLRSDERQIALFDANRKKTDAKKKDEDSIPIASLSEQEDRP